jgi:hypothetical protein
MDMRTTTLAVAAFAIGVALLVLWLGHRHDHLIDRLVAEGQLAQGRYLSSTPASSAGDGSIDVAYEVDGVAYRTSMLTGNPQREPVFEAGRIRVPRLGPERPDQVVYLPSDPATARLREDLSKTGVAVYGTAGLFFLCGLVFGAAGLFLLRRGATRPDSRRTAPAMSRRSRMIGFAVVFVSIWAAGLYVMFFL